MMQQKLVAMDTHYRHQISKVQGRRPSFVLPPLDVLAA
jgi:hypothetical protein